MFDKLSQIIYVYVSGTHCLERPSSFDCILKTNCLILPVVEVNIQL